MVETSIIGGDLCGSFRHEVFVDDAFDTPIDPAIFTTSLTEESKTLDMVTADFDKV